MNYFNMFYPFTGKVHGVGILNGVHVRISRLMSSKGEPIPSIKNAKYCAAVIIPISCSESSILEKFLHDLI